jgi:hypothetical protein
VDGNANDRATSRRWRKKGSECIPLVVLWFKHFAPAMQTYDLWRALKRAEHQHDAAVLSKVRDGFNAAAHHVEIRNRIRSKHAERVKSLRRQVDVPGAPSNGAVATKKTRCASMKARTLGSIS